MMDRVYNSIAGMTVQLKKLEIELKKDLALPILTPGRGFMIESDKEYIREFKHVLYQLHEREDRARASGRVFNIGLIHAIGGKYSKGMDKKDYSRKYDAYIKKKPNKVKRKNI